MFKAVLMLLILLPASILAREPIVWGTDEWENFTDRDGSGFYQALMNQVFEQEAYQVNVNYYPWKRVLKYLQQNKIHMTGAVPGSKDFHLSEQPILSEGIFAVSLVPLESTQYSDRLGAYRTGYDEDIFYHVMPKEFESIGVDSIAAAKSLLKSGKVDYFVDVFSLVQANFLDKGAARYHKKQIGHFHLYWAFNKTLEGLKLKRYFDKRFKKLRESGELERIYQQYSIALPKPK